VQGGITGTLTLANLQCLLRELASILFPMTSNANFLIQLPCLVVCKLPENFGTVFAYIASFNASFWTSREFWVIQRVALKLAKRLDVFLSGNTNIEDFQAPSSVPWSLVTSLISSDERRQFKSALSSGVSVPFSFALLTEFQC
jgi:hypothetical protein